PGVEHLGHGRMRGEHVRHPRGIEAVAVHAHRKGPDPAQRQPRVERAGYPAGRGLVESEALAGAGAATTTAPPITAERPPRYLVVEGTTASAPSASGFCR